MPNFITCSCRVDKNRAAVVLKIYALVQSAMKAPKVGDRVQVTVAAAMGKKLAIQRYGACSKVKKLSEGSGRGRKWRV